MKKKPFLFSLHIFFGEVSAGADKIKVRPVLNYCGKKNKNKSYHNRTKKT